MAENPEVQKLVSRLRETADTVVAAHQLDINKEHVAIDLRQAANTIEDLSRGPALEGEAMSAALLFSCMLDSIPKSTDIGDLVNYEGATMETVVYHALGIASERFNPREDDPGWNAEYQEDQLRDAVLAYALAILVRRANAKG